MDTGDILLGGGGNPAMDQHPVQGGRSNTPRHALCYRNQDKLRPFGPSACVRLCLSPFYNKFRVVEILWSNVADMKLNLTLIISPACLPRKNKTKRNERRKN